MQEDGQVGWANSIKSFRDKTKERSEEERVELRGRKRKERKLNYYMHNCIVLHLHTIISGNRWKDMGADGRLSYFVGPK